MLKIKNKRITLRYRQHLDGLLNIIIPILILPLQMIHLALKFSNKLYKMLPYIHNNPVSYVKVLNTTSVYVDATPTQIALIDLDQREIEIFRCNNKILDN